MTRHTAVDSSYSDTESNLSIEAHMSSAGIDAAWVKIKHIDSDPKTGELNLTLDRVIVLHAMLGNVIDRNRQLEKEENDA